MRIVDVGRAFPRHFYEQETLLAALRAHWGQRHRNPARLERLHRNVLVGGRHLALPLQEYPQLTDLLYSLTSALWEQPDLVEVFDQEWNDDSDWGDDDIDFEPTGT